jgi:hypothetical protein
MDENAFIIQVQALSFKREQFLFKIRNISVISSAQKGKKYSNIPFTQLYNVLSYK